MKNWLKDLREKNNLTQKELSEKVGINLNTIQNIEQGKRKGTPENVQKLMDFFNNNSIKISYDSEDLINELKEDIEEFGENEVYYAMFTIKGYGLFLSDYDFIDEKLSDSEINSYDLVLELPAKDILKILEVQNKIL